MVQLGEELNYNIEIEDKNKQDPHNKEKINTAIELAINAASTVVAQQVQGDYADKLVDTAIQDLKRHLN